MTEDGASLLGAIFGSLKCSKAFRCSRDFDQYGGIALWFALMLYMFKALGTICDEYFVPSLEVIVEKLQLSNDVAGATFMAAGSSAPELFTSLVATFLIVNAGGVGTIVGSAIFNILVMNGVTCYFACRDQELIIWWYPLARDTTFYTLAIIELVCVLWDEEVKWWEGFIMVLTYLLYCVYMKWNPRAVELIRMWASGKAKTANTDSWWEPSKADCGCNSPKSITPEEPPTTIGRPMGSAGSDQSKAHWSYRQSFEHTSSTQAVTPEPDSDGDPTIPPDATSSGVDSSDRSSSCCREPFSVLLQIFSPAPERGHGFFLFFWSIFWIGFLTYIMVDSTNRIGIILNIPPFVMGLIFLAAGTSIPDTLGSIAVAKQGEGDMAVANALGSNVFDILIGLGVPWTVRALFQDVKFEDQFGELMGDISILVAVLALFVLALALNRWKLNRKIGAILIMFYFAFVLYQMLAVFAFKWKKNHDDE